MHLPQDNMYDVDTLWLVLVELSTAAFLMGFITEAISKSNVFELLTFHITSLFLLVRVIYDMAIYRDTESAQLRSFEWLGAVAAVSGGFNLWFVVCSMRIRNDLRWSKYYLIGTDPRARRLYLLYETYLSSLKLDVQFSIQVWISTLVLVTPQFPSYSPGLLCAQAVVEVVWKLAGYSGIKYKSSKRSQGEQPAEQRRVSRMCYMWVFWALSGIMPAVAIVMLYLVSTAPVSSARDEWAQKHRSNRLLFLTVVAVLNRALTVGMSIWLSKYFTRPEFKLLESVFASAVTKGKMARADTIEGASVPNPITSTLDTTTLSIDQAMLRQERGASWAGARRSSGALDRLDMLNAVGSTDKSTQPAPGAQPAAPSVSQQGVSAARPADAAQQAPAGRQPAAAARPPVAASIAKATPAAAPQAPLTHSSAPASAPAAPAPAPAPSPVAAPAPPAVAAVPGPEEDADDDDFIARMRRDFAL